MEPETIFKALADRTRQRTLAVLARHELSVSELVHVLQQPQSTVSRHLKVLRESTLIHDRRVGTTVLYAVPEQGDGRGGVPLRDRVLDWIGEQRMPSALDDRLAAVIQRRRQMSDSFFDELGQRWDALRQESFGDRFQLEAFWALLPPDWIVADIGTGTGFLLPTLAGHFRRVIAVDPVERMLEACRTRVDAGCLANVDLRAGDLSALPIESGEVDLAVAALVLHHVPVPAQAIQELGRVVKPDGRVLIIEQGLHEDERFRERMQDRWFGFTPEETEEWLQDVGFTALRHRALSTVDPADDAPGLFVITGTKGVRGFAEEPCAPFTEHAKKE